MKTCLICGEEDWIEEFELYDIFEELYHFGCCQSCKVYSLNPFPNQKQLHQAYDESYYGYGDKKFNPTVEKVIDWFRLQNAKRFAKNLPSQARVLDIGCGNGTFLNYLGKLGAFELHGIEPQGKSGDRAEQIPNINLHRGYLEPEVYQNEYFDAIVLTHVFEHLPNPMESLEIVTSIARNTTLLQIEIPNIESWQFQIFKRQWLHLDPPRHLNMFPAKILEAKLKELGWSLESKSYFSPQFSPFGAQQSIINVMLQKRDVLYEHLKGNKDYTRDYSELSLLFQKLFHWVSFPLFVCADLIASQFKKGATIRLVFTKL